MAQAEFFSAGQMIDIAIQTEQAGYAFYQAAVEATDSPQVRALCEWLAGEEQVHERVFQEMKEKLAPQEVIEEWPGEKTEFINALIGSRFMPKPEEAQVLVRDMSAQGILDFALNFEKDTIIFLYEMRNMVASGDTKQVNQVIAEEKTHVSRILKAKASINK